MMAHRFSRAVILSSTSPRPLKARLQAVMQRQLQLTRKHAAAVFSTPPSSRASKLELHGVRSWCISYGSTPAAWVVTDHAWCAQRFLFLGVLRPLCVTRASAGTACDALRPTTQPCLRQLLRRLRLLRAPLRRLRHDATCATATRSRFFCSRFHATSTLQA